MLEGLAEFAVNNKWPLIFYTVLILLIIGFRRKFEWQGIAGLYKTTVGVKLMKRLGEKHRALVQWLGYVGIGVGFTGMAVIIWMLGLGLWNLVFKPDAPAVIAPVIPGFNIPGVGIEVPLITGWLALFAVIVVHEFSHGVVSKAHKIPVKSSGLLVFGPILGAFVEPEEKKLEKAHETVQYSVFAAGPFSNIIAAALAILILMPLIGLAVTGMTEASGVTFSVNEGLPADQAGLEEGLITAINGQPVKTTDDIVDALDSPGPGEEVTLTADGEQYTLTTVADEANPERGLVGITGFQNERQPTSGIPAWVIAVVLWIQEFVKWLFILNLGIGLANLLPLGPVDGGQMIRTLFTNLWGKAKGEYRWKQLSKVTLVVILVLLFLPIIKAI